jgi:3,4-dihydroxy 2-butanone 4-phosphate synthase/GTP cyclohydrolase II
MGHTLHHEGMSLDEEMIHAEHVHDQQEAAHGD